MVKVTFDAQGKVARVVLARATGYPELDSNTINFITANWHRAPGRASTITLPVKYRLASH